jgi:hypothetical protein
VEDGSIPDGGLHLIFTTKLITPPQVFPAAVDIGLATIRKNTMSTESISASRPFSTPPGLSRLLGALRNPSDTNSGNQRTTSPIPSTSLTPFARDQVSLSPQGRALQQNDLRGQADVLSELTRESLSILTPDAGSATISFDQLTYSNSSSVSFQRSGNRTQFLSEQQSSVTGTGRITTASGEEFEFTAELEVTQVLGVRQTTAANTGTSNNANAIADAIATADNFIQLQLPKLPNLVDAGNQLLDLLQQSKSTKPSKLDTDEINTNLLSLLDTLGNNKLNDKLNSKLIDINERAAA